MKMTLIQHFAEFRRRILLCIIFFIIFFVLGWSISNFIEHFLIKPLSSIWSDGKFLYNGLTDGLLIKFSLATTFSLLFTIPVFLWHIWRFVSPGLHKNEKKILLLIILFSPILFIIGVLFSFYILLPIIFNFFMKLNNSSSIPNVILPAIKDYLYFAIKMLKVFGIAFQLPLIIIMLNKIGILSYEAIKKSRRYAIIIIFIISAMLTPPDIISQLLLALPMILLFELSLFVIKKIN